MLFFFKYKGFVDEDEAGLWKISVLLNLVRSNYYKCLKLIRLVIRCYVNNEREEDELV